MKYFIFTLLFFPFIASANTCGAMHGRSWDGGIMAVGPGGTAIMDCRIRFTKEGKVVQNIAFSRCIDRGIVAKLFGEVKRTAFPQCKLTGAIRLTWPSGAREWMRFRNVQSNKMKRGVWTGTARDENFNVTYTFALQR